MTAAGLPLSVIIFVYCSDLIDSRVKQNEDGSHCECRRREDWLSVAWAVKEEIASFDLIRLKNWECHAKKATRCPPSFRPMINFFSVLRCESDISLN